jgi:hypothetical protein
VTAGRRHLERVAERGLAAEVGKVEAIVDGLLELRRPWREARLLAGPDPAQVGQALDRHDARGGSAVDRCRQPRFIGAVRGDDDPPDARPSGPLGHC